MARSLPLATRRAGGRRARLRAARPRRGRLRRPLRAARRGQVRRLRRPPPTSAADTASNSGIFASSGNASVFPMLDAAVKASGASSLRFTIPSSSGADTSGAYFTNFSPDLSVQFGESSEFYIQWRQRFTADFATTDYAGGGGWKQTIIGSGDQPGGSPLLLLHGPRGRHRQRLLTAASPRCTTRAAARPRTGRSTGSRSPSGPSTSSSRTRAPSPYCLYSQTHTSPSTAFPPSGNCFGYFPDEWMTFQVHIQTGPRQGDEFADSLVELWIAREGQPSELAIRWGPYNLDRGQPGRGPEVRQGVAAPVQHGKERFGARIPRRTRGTTS